MAAKKELTLQDVIDSVKSSLKETEERIEEQIKVNTQKIDASSKSTENKLLSMERSLNEFTDRVVTLEQENQTQASNIKQLEKKVEILEHAARSHNVIVEGILEEKNENIRQKIDELFEQLDLPFDSDWVDSVYRIGVRNDNTKRPRAIKVNFPFLRYRNELFRNLHKLKLNQKYKKVYVVDDFPPETQEKIKELRAISAFSRSQGLDSRMKGANLVIDGKAYAHENMDKLPDKLSMEAAKLIEVEDGIAFQGKHAYLSNHHPCEINFGDKKYNTSEKAYQHTRALENNEGGVARQIYEQTELKEIIRLSKLIKDTPEWKQKEVPTMAIIIRHKFDQNPHLKAKLCKTKGHLYEATTHKVFGCGFLPAQHTQIKKANVTAGNKLGEELERLRDDYNADTT